MQPTVNPISSGSNGVLKADLKYYAWLVGLTALFGLLIFGWLPGLGIGLPMKLFGYKALLLAMAGVAGGVLYVEYLGYWRRRPEFFLIFCTIFPVLWNYLGEQLIAVGISLRGTLLLFPLVIVPALLVVGRSGIATIRAFPFLKLLSVFLAWTTLLFLFHNINYQPPISANLTAIGVSRYNDFGSLFLYSVFFEFVCAVAAAWLVSRTPDHRAFFERFNQVLALFTLAISIIPVIVFPLGGARIMLEGVWRSTGIFTHPNINAFYLSFLSLYFLGVFLAGVHRSRKSGLLLLSAAVTAGIAILFTFSKTVLFGHLVALAVLLLIHAGTRGSLRKMLVSSAVLLGAGALLLICVDALSGNEVSRTLFGRLENSRSLDWRLDLWGRLMTDMHAGAWLFGNGLTAAYQRVYEWLYLDSNPELMVSMQPHNIMIHFVYEMGLLGLAYTLALLRLAVSPTKLPPTLKGGKNNLLLRSLPVLLFGVYILYYSFNNYDLISGGLLWIVMSVLVVYQQRETAFQQALPSSPPVSPDEN
jgi:O-antigen ligase